MWLEQKGDLIVIAQGMGENAYIFYHRFWGFVAKADCPTPEECEKQGKCEFTLYLSQQATASKLERIIKGVCGKVWGKITFKYMFVDNDYIGIPTKFDLIINQPIKGAN